MEIKVCISLVDGEDVAPFATQTLTFTPTTFSQEISIAIIDDDILEEMENFIVYLSMPTSMDRVNIDNENTTVVIIDDDREFIRYRCSEFIWSHASVVFNPTLTLQSHKYRFILMVVK